MERLIDALIPLVSVALGWLLAQHQARNEDAKDTKRILNRVLSDLLEARSRLMAMRLISEFFRDTFHGTEIPSGMLKEVLNEVPEQVLWDENIQIRSEKALDELAAVRPLTAYVIRAAGLLGQLQKLLHTESFGEAEYLDALVGGVGKSIRQSFDTMILAVAESLGKKTEAHVRLLLKEEQRNQPQLQQQIEQVRRVLKQALENCTNAS